jgi:HAD superfamily hydrolase (TIGR01509 family)
VLRAVVFDFDGVILDTEEPEYASWHRAWADHGVELHLDEWVRCIGTVGAFDPMAELVARAAGPVDRATVDERRRTHHRSLVAANVILPGVEALLDECRVRGVHVAVASSSPVSWVDGHLRRLGLVDRFTGLHCFDGTRPAKPAPDLYRCAVEALGVEPPEAVAIEDSLHGVTAAKSAGLRCVAVPGPMTRHLDLSAADLRVESLAGVTVADLEALPVP